MTRRRRWMACASVLPSAKMASMETLSPNTIFSREQWTAASSKEHSPRLSQTASSQLEHDALQSSLVSRASLRLRLDTLPSSDPSFIHPLLRVHPSIMSPHIVPSPVPDSPSSDGRASLMGRRPLRRFSIVPPAFGSGGFRAGEEMANNLGRVLREDRKLEGVQVVRGRFLGDPATNKPHRHAWGRTLSAERAGRCWTQLEGER